MRRAPVELLSIALSAAVTCGAVGCEGTNGATGDLDASMSMDSSSSVGDGGAGDSADDAMTREFELPYFPLEPGLSWTYATSKEDGTVGTQCMNKGDRVTRSLVAANQFDIGTAVEVINNPSCGGSRIYFYSSDGDAFALSHPPTLYFDFPPEAGHEWEVAAQYGIKGHWSEHLDTLAVQGNTFKDCWRAEFQFWTMTVCRGVGIVVQTSSLDDTRFELVSWNF